MKERDLELEGCASSVVSVSVSVSGVLMVGDDESMVNFCDIKIFWGI